MIDAVRINQAASLLRQAMAFGVTAPSKANLLMEASDILEAAITEDSRSQLVIYEIDTLKERIAALEEKG